MPKKFDLGLVPADSTIVFNVDWQGANYFIRLNVGKLYPTCYNATFANPPRNIEANGALIAELITGSSQ